MTFMRIFTIVIISFGSIVQLKSLFTAEKTTDRIAHFIVCGLNALMILHLLEILK